MIHPIFGYAFSEATICCSWPAFKFEFMKSALEPVSPTCHSLALRSLRFEQASSLAGQLLGWDGAGRGGPDS